MTRLNNKIVLVTGIGNKTELLNNGKAIAMRFAQEGAYIEGTDIDKKAGTSTQQTITSMGYNCSFTETDVTKEDEVSSWIRNCVKKHQRIDILVNNVGQSEPGGPAQLDMTTWDRQIELNLNSAFLTMKYSIPKMVEQQSGVIVNISSIAGLRYIGKPQVGYSASKAGLIQLTKTSAIIHAKDGIRMNSVVPGLIDTPLVARMAKKYSTLSLLEYKKLRNSTVPMGFMGSAEDVANAALFLASDEARYITGTELVVDGGLSATTGDLF